MKYCKGRNYWVVLNLGELGNCSFPMVTVLVIMATANQTTVAMVPPCQTDQSPKLSTTQYFYPYSSEKFGTGIPLSLCVNLY